MTLFRVRIAAEYVEDIEADTPAQAAAFAWDQIDWRNPNTVVVDDVYRVRLEEDDKAA